jgi:nitronate monooxygenase
VSARGTSLLCTRYPIVQAPMAGASTPELVAAVSNAGGLGSLGAALLAPDDLRAAIREIRARTDAPFGVNLFVPPWSTDDQLAVVLEERVPLFSFVFGTMDAAPLREAGILVLGTATTPEEARALDVDVVVAQGAEAGGHRGTFLGSADDAMLPLAELVPAIEGPAIAAGGITTADDVRAALALGAAGVQVGTAFLFTPEAGVARAWLDALRTYETVVTPAYTGRHARAARTPFLERLMAGPPPLPFPEQRRAVQRRPDAEGFFLGGTGARRTYERPAAELVETLAAGL